MKNLKRALLILLMLVLCVSVFFGCDMGKQNDGEGSGEQNPGEGEQNPGEGEQNPGEGEKPSEGEYDIITIAEALELCGEVGNLTTERYYLRGVILSVDNPQYGAMTIKDETGSISVYGTYSADGSIGYADMADKPYKGDTVLLHCTLQNYNGNKEVKNARLISFEKADVTVDEKDYTDMSVAEAREADVGVKIKLDGVVAAITYSNGQKPAGVILVDNTQSIYVYDVNLAGRVRVGNTVTVLGSKTYWVLESEQYNAEKFGYKGCCQIEDVTVVSIDESVKEFDRSWISETAVKEILETPVTENITSSLFKVTALVKKVDGSGFVNYYINDLDGTTGTYTYTQCNGSDFAWLDEFDGKICTVYLTALNAKSTSTDCFFRFIPVDVKDEGFVFDTADTAEHIVKYYGVPQFNKVYTGNPAAELVGRVSSELLGFEDAVIEYFSSNEAVVYFENNDGKIIFNCGEEGTATVTVKGSYGGVTYEETVKISVASNEVFDTITVKEAIETAVGETVTVRGIVGPSVVNKAAFYLFDGTGMVAVVVKNENIFKEIEIGQEIVISAKRDVFKDADKTHAGQIALSGAEVLANYYGYTEYSEAGFITDKDLAYIYNLDVNEDHSAEVYVVRATVLFNETQYYTNVKLSDGNTQLTLYCSSGKQYNFLKEFAGQEVTLEIAPCNWNNKTYYAGCVLAVITEDGKVLNELNFVN